MARDGNFLKDISLAESDLSKVCLVDNSPIAFELFKGIKKKMNALKVMLK